MCRRIQDVEIVVRTTLLPGPSDELPPFCSLLDADFGIGGGAMPLLPESCCDSTEGVVEVGVGDAGALETDEACDVVVA